MNDWKSDKKWADKFLPQIKRILGETLICEPPIEEDQERNTDLIVLKMDSVRIGCRIRRNQYYKRYCNEFTIRAGRPSGTKTELAKIIEGWGDYFFYGFSDEQDDLLIFWRVADLKVFRGWFASKLVRMNSFELPGTKQKNSDKSSEFLVFKWADFPSNFVISR